MNKKVKSESIEVAIRIRPLHSNESDAHRVVEGDMELNTVHMRDERTKMDVRV